MKLYWLIADLLRVRLVRGLVLLALSPAIWFGAPLLLRGLEHRGVDMAEYGAALTVLFILRVALAGYFAIAGLWTLVVAIAE